jgi:hypothetical protein
MSTMEEYEQELRQIRKIVEENNEILKGLKKKARYAMIFGALKWFIYIGIAIGLFTVIKPFIEGVLGTYSSLQENMQAVEQIKENGPLNLSNIDLNKISDLLKR